MKLDEAKKQLKRVQKATGGWGSIYYIKKDTWEETPEDAYTIWLPASTGYGGDYITTEEVESLLKRLERVNIEHGL